VVVEETDVLLTRDEDAEVIRRVQPGEVLEGSPMWGRLDDYTAVLQDGGIAFVQSAGVRPEPGEATPPPGAPAPGG
jgi:hypothetical protein